MDINKLRFYHYTSAGRLPKILESGNIYLSRNYIGKKEKPGVWLTTSPEWERTSTSMIMKDGVLTSLSEEEMYLNHGWGRIEVKPSPSFVNIKKFGKTSNIDPRVLQSLIQTGIAKGSNPDDWYMSYIPILSRYFLSVEMNIKKEWVKCTDWNKIGQFVKEGMETNRLFYTK